MLFINKTLMKLAKGLWGWIFAITGLKLITLVGITLFAEVISGFLGNITSPGLTVDTAGTAIGTAFLAAMITLAAELARGEAEFRCSAKTRTGVRKKIFEKILELDAGNIEKIGPVSAITSSVDGAEALQIYYCQYLPGLIYCFIAPFYLFVQLKDISLSAAVLLFLIAIALLPLNNVFRQKIEKLKTQYWDSMEDLTGYYLESVQGLTTFKLFKQDENREKVLSGKATDFNNRVMSFMKVNFTAMVLTNTMIYGGITAAVILSGIMLAKGSISLSSALMILLLSYGFFDSFKSLMSVSHTAMSGVAAAEKIEKLLAMDTTRPYSPSIPKQANAFDGIQLEHIFYSYSGRKISLQDINISIPKGKITALCGLSGCGKSTVAGLLMRFFDPSSGKISLEGRNYISFTPEQLRQNIIMVPQTVSIFSGTVAQNLRMAKKDASDEELLEVLDKVRLKEWIENQPDGLNTDVGDAGGKLSGGQRQKIGIARALLCNAEYIIFDEATSSVDMDSEREIWNCIDSLSHTRTLIIISHRLSTIKNADSIYVLDGGKIVESGRHDELMKQSGLYYRLVTEQAELEGGAAL